MTLVEQIVNRSISQRAKTHILCVCAGGNTRSVTLATLLKFHFGGYDALACSITKNSRGTLEMLFDWADLVIAVDNFIFGELTDSHKDILDSDKVMLVHIGKDRWGMSMHSELVPLACRLLEEAGFKRSNKTDWSRVGQKYGGRRKEPDGPTIYMPS